MPDFEIPVPVGDGQPHCPELADELKPPGEPYFGWGMSDRITYVSSSIRK